MHCHFVRVGLMGHVGRFSAVDSTLYPRGTRVICRTARGLEVGEVLSTSDTVGSPQGDGELIRGMTVEDHLLWERIERNQNDAFLACTRLLDQQGVSAALMDVEHLFDGRSIYFYFLGEPPAEVERLSSELADAYEAKVQFRKFTDTVIEGCGPGCGTDQAENGCQTGACSTCAVASACGVRS